MNMNFGRHSLSLDPIKEIDHISASLRNFLVQDLRRRGLVIGLSGGIDSSVTAALAVNALGKNRVYGLLMPERDSSPETRVLSRNLAKFLGIDHSEEDITAMLEAAGFYRRYDAAVQSVIPGFGVGWKSKIVTSGLNENAGFTFFRIVAQSP